MPANLELHGLLKAHGIRVTVQRLALLRELGRIQAPVSHPELAERLTTSNLDRATVYRNLRLLARAGLLVRTLVGGTVWRYELPRQGAARHADHPHLVCTECGRVTCLSADSVTLHRLESSCQVVEIQLRGRCASCSSQVGESR